MKKTEIVESLRDEIKQIRKRRFDLRDDNAFVLWFLLAQLLEWEDRALKCLTGATGDKCLDAVYVDSAARQVHMVQGKFREGLGHHSEKRNDLIAFSQLANLPWYGSEQMSEFRNGLDEVASRHVDELVHAVRKNHYAVRMYYVTTGRCSETFRNDAIQIASNASRPATLSVIDSSQIPVLYRDYESIIVPAIPPLALPLAMQGISKSEGVIDRYDGTTGIQSFIFSMAGKDVGELYKRYENRIFARNIRGDLGPSTEINDAIAKSLKHEANNFWYYNNGVTIVCDAAKLEKEAGRTVIRVERAQIINGQQTTIRLSEVPSSVATVLVRVISVPRGPDGDDEYDRLVSRIVRATNWQNAIKPSDLVSNDSIQIFLERELRKIGYQYIRKSESKRAARRRYGEGYTQITKKELAKTIGACHYDPSLLPAGVEKLFDERYYGTIFGSRMLGDYLAPYWLIRQIQYLARGDRDRGYARWLVLHFVWDVLGSKLQSGLAERRFRGSCEQGEWSILKPLYDALGVVF
ncbi:MAG: AIPR family protein, partial [Terriglobales bacterium]